MFLKIKNNEVKIKGIGCANWKKASELSIQRGFITPNHFHCGPHAIMNY